MEVAPVRSAHSCTAFLDQARQNKTREAGWLLATALDPARTLAQQPVGASFCFFSFLIFFSGSSLAVKVHALISQGMTQGCLYQARAPRFTQSAAKISTSQRFIDLLYNLYKKASYCVTAYSCYSPSPIDASRIHQTSSLSIFQFPMYPYTVEQCVISIFPIEPSPTL